MDIVKHKKINDEETYRNCDSQVSAELNSDLKQSNLKSVCSKTNKTKTPSGNTSLPSVEELRNVYDLGLNKRKREEESSDKALTQIKRSSQQKQRRRKLGFNDRGQ